ncbi:hypothetical protein [Pontibacter pudoricolor]|uniref:hypothetical protein n=1 Tax=Pontibacter pudoricolor TaxID=2694930 RepID=UPI0013907DF5|nr:hypothetical protein [Pontibacter pudoricolor]
MGRFCRDNGQVSKINGQLLIEPTIVYWLDLAVSDILGRVNGVLIYGDSEVHGSVLSDLEVRKSFWHPLL